PARCVLPNIFSPKAATTCALTTRLTTLYCWNMFQTRRCVCNVSSFEYTTCRPPQTSSPYLLLYRQQDVRPNSQPHVYVPFVYPPTPVLINNSHLLSTLLVSRFAWSLLDSLQLVRLALSWQSEWVSGTLRTSALALI